MSNSRSLYFQSSTVIVEVGSPNFYTSGNVTIHPSAAIAPNVFLHAEVNSEIVISSGVSIGAGAILHAHQGNLEVEPGAVIGSGVLIVGSGKIGTNACIGSMSTILESSIEAEQVVEPGSIIGDRSRVVPECDTSSQSKQASSLPEPGSPADQLEQPSAKAVQDPTRTQVYGQASLNKIMLALFPHRQSLNSSSSNEDT